MSRPSSPRAYARTPGGLIVPMHARVRGRVRWQTLDERGVPEIPRNPGGFAIGPIEGVEQPNLITDIGMDRIGTDTNCLDAEIRTNGFRRSLAVGTGSTAPAVTDTTLVAEVQRASSAGSYASEGYNLTVDGTAEEYTIESIARRLVTMTADRNLTEFGLSSSATAGTAIEIRELFRDGSETPITISLLTGKSVLVTHSFLVTLPYPVSPAAAVLNIEEYDAANVLTDTLAYDIVHAPHGFATETNGTGFSTTSWGVLTCWSPGLNNVVRRITAASTWTRTTSSTAPGSIVVEDGTALATVAPISYSSGSFERVKQGTIPTGSGNAAWYGVMIPGSSTETYRYGGHVTLFTSPTTYTKVNTDTMRVGIRSTWARA